MPAPPTAIHHRLGCAVHDTSRHARIFAQEFSGRQARRIVAQLTGLHRIKASPDLLAAARLAHELAKAAGLADLRLHEFPTDGKGFWWTFKKPWFWSPRSAELRLIAPEEAVLARFADEPCRLGDFSAATPAGGVVAEVVDVGQGLAEADYAGKDLAGKVALVSGAGWNSRRVSAQAARHAAIGIIGDSLVEVPPARTRENAAEQVGYARVWVDPAGSSPFWFGVNYQQMQYLKRLLAAGRGPLRVRAAVDAALGEGTLPAVSGVIPGSGRPEEEVLLVAHICHGAPGANDNASGSALLLEMAAAWCRLIADGRLPRPSRTIRFLWLPEWYGTAAYLHAHPDWPDRLRAVICCDMVGEDQQACGGPLLLERGPDTLPAFLNDLAEHFLEQLTAGAGSYFSDSAGDLWKYQVVPYGGGSDHSFFVDRTCGVPAVYIGHWPDRFYHSSHDTVDKVDPAELEKVAWLTFQLASLLQMLARPKPRLFARETAERGLGRLGRAASEALWSLHDLPPEDPAEPYSTRVADICGAHWRRWTIGRKSRWPRSPRPVGWRPEMRPWPRPWLPAGMSCRPGPRGLRWNSWTRERRWPGPPAGRLLPVGQLPPPKSSGPTGSCPSAAGPACSM